MTEKNKLRLMTYNIGGGRKDLGTETAGVLEIIQRLSPDFLAIQECSAWTDADGVQHNLASKIAEAGGYGSNYFLAPTLSMQENMQVKKIAMLQALYQDWIDWGQGNAVFNRTGFSRLSDPTISGIPRNIPLYKPPIYQGTRDTDPRYALITRFQHGTISPFAVCVHLTTLVGERGGIHREIPGRSEEAELMRIEQTKRILDLVQLKQAENQVILLMGDFNASANEISLASVIEDEGKFTRLVPKNEIPTHPKVKGAVDHIFVFPGERIESYDCWIEDDPPAQSSSDHLPVVADIIFR
jgi:endonuclease/exonuclease/phosphatase family metal-dependent hydrolase